MPSVEAAWVKSSMKSRSLVASMLFAVGPSKSRALGGDGAVERESRTGDCSGAKRAEVHAGRASARRRDVALDHADVGEQPVRNEDGLGTLQVGVGRA